jgi:DNA-binding CsgD family transcriptional regulator
MPERLHVARQTAVDEAVNAAFDRYVASTEIPLTSGVLEAELVRRRVAAVVCDARNEPRAFRPLIEVSRTRSYVVAPIVTGASVVGLLHADRYTSGRMLTEFDRDNLQAFADGVGLLCERAGLLERLGEQRKRIAAAFMTSEAVITELAGTPVRLARPERQTLPRTPRPPAQPHPPVPNGLTSRERDVLSLMSSGATNAQIADQLTVSESTVKSHVKHILRKLGAANRTEAIVRCLGTALPSAAAKSRSDAP